MTGQQTNVCLRRKVHQRHSGARAGGLEEAAVSQQDDTAAGLRDVAEEVANGLRGTSIFLVGMMGSGKSTIGKILAESLGYYFFDSDAVVEAAAGGASTAQIFAENGEEAFRDIESQAIAELSATVRLVVATGGGAVVRTANWGKMRDGISVWIDAPVDVLASRVLAAGTDSRPLLHQGGGAGEGGQSQTEVAAKLAKILDERRAMYANADAAVSLQEVAATCGLEDSEQLTSARVALEVLSEIRELLRDRQRMDKENREQPGSEMHV